MILNSLLNKFSRIMHSNPTPSPPEESKDPRTAGVFRKSAESLQVLHKESSLKVAGDSMTFCSPALGEEALELNKEGGQVHAFKGGQELPVKHTGAHRFTSTHGAKGTDPSNEIVELPDGRQVTLTDWGKTMEVKVQQGNSPVFLDLWFRHGEEEPTVAAFKQRGLDVEFRDEQGLSIKEHPMRDGPTEGHLTTFSKGKFESRNWHDGFCDPSVTSPQDIERVIAGGDALLSAGGALFAR